MVGLPIAGIGTLFYVVLLLGMGAAKLWRWGVGVTRRIGNRLLPGTIRSVLRGQPPVIRSDGSFKRDYVYVEDVCRLMSISCDRLDASATFNLGTGKATSLNQLLTILQETVPCPATVEYLPGRASDIASISLSSERLLSLAPGFTFTPLEEGLQRTLAHHRLIPDHEGGEIS